MRRLVFVLLLALLPGIGAAAEPDRPAWCLPGYECVKTSEMTANTVLLIDLREKLREAKAVGRRWGWSVGPGIGVSGVVDRNYDVSYIPGGGFYVVWGLRFGSLKP